MKWIKKWSFIWIIVVLGVIFLSVSDSWKVMAEPYVQAMSWLAQYQEPGEEAAAVSRYDEGGQTVEGNQKAEDNQKVDGNQRLEAGQIGEGREGDTGSHAAQDGQTGRENPSGTGEEGIGGNPGSGIEFRNPEDVVYVRAEDDYFADALFIGDSRTVGMLEYGGLEEIASFYASTGMTIYKVLEFQVVEVPMDEETSMNGEQASDGGQSMTGGLFGEKRKMTIEEALQKRQFSKIYLMIGINEMGTGTVETFIEKYQEVLERLKELQPDAVIYLQGIMKVTTDRSNQGDYINNAGIEERNAEIAKLADYIRVYYLDVNPLICDETGGMEPTYTSDGVHLKAMYIPIWKEFLKDHTVLLD